MNVARNAVADRIEVHKYWYNETIPMHTNELLISAYRSICNTLGAAMQVAFEKSAFAIIATLVAAGVTGLWTLSINVGKLEERVSSWTALYERRFDGMERKFDKYEIEQIRIREEMMRRH